MAAVAWMPCFCSASFLHTRGQPEGWRARPEPRPTPCRLCTTSVQHRLGAHAALSGRQATATRPAPAPCSTEHSAAQHTARHSRPLTPPGPSYAAAGAAWRRPPQDGPPPPPQAPASRSPPSRPARWARAAQRGGAGVQVCVGVGGGGWAQEVMGRRMQECKHALAISVFPEARSHGSCRETRGHAWQQAAAASRQQPLPHPVSRAEKVVGDGGASWRRSALECAVLAWRRRLAQRAASLEPSPVGGEHGSGRRCGGLRHGIDEEGGKGGGGGGGAGGGCAGREHDVRVPPTVRCSLPPLFCWAPPSLPPSLLLPPPPHLIHAAVWAGHRVLRRPKVVQRHLPVGRCTAEGQAGACVRACVCACACV